MYSQKKYSGTFILSQGVKVILPMSAFNGEVMKLVYNVA